MTKIELNNKKYNLVMHIKDLRELGLVPNDSQGNIEKMSGIMSGLMTGDVFTLIDVLASLLKGQLKRGEIEEALSRDEDIDKIFDKVESFFETSPLTKKMATMIAQPAKEALANL